ncbi:O-antigen ligase family protein [candidate division KSB1 bacterium]|nr:O-antigen ligase family protein [candidate division KSB1 bacterium]
MPVSTLLMIAVLEMVFFLLLAKSFVFGMAFVVLVSSMFLLFLFPEVGLVAPFTGNIILFVFFDTFKVDITAPVVIAYFALMTLGVGLYYAKRMDHAQLELGTPFWLSISIGLVMIIGLAYSSNRTYGISKILFYFIYNVPLLAVPLIFRNDLKKLEHLLVFGYLVGIFLGLICLSIEGERLIQYQRFSPSDSVNPIFLARSLGISGLCAFFLLVKTRGIFLKFLILASLPILFIPMIWSGSRAPFAGMILILFLFYLLQPSEPLFRKIIVSSIGLVGAIFFLAIFASQIAARLVTPVAQDTSTAFRFIAWIQAAEQFMGAPLTGIGTGSFFLDNPIIPLIYPHNLALELACEHGIIGLILISAFIYISIKSGFQNIKYYAQAESNQYLQLSIMVLCLFFYSLMNSMFSGDITYNYLVWLTAGFIRVMHLSKNMNQVQFEALAK